MLPRWHIVYGAFFALAIYAFAPWIEWQYIVLIFLSSFLIDFDHYVNSVYKTGKWGLFDSFRYYKKDGEIAERERAKGIRRQGNFMFFHPVEVILLIFIIGFFWKPAFYVFAGMVFHSLLDVYEMARTDYLYRREFFLFNWVKKNYFQK